MSLATQKMLQRNSTRATLPPYVALLQTTAISFLGIFLTGAVLIQIFAWMLNYGKER